MADVDPLATQRGPVADIPAELRQAGFDDVEEVGHGGFGVVYRCAQPMLDRTVAVKVLTSDLDPDNLDRFLLAALQAQLLLAETLMGAGREAQAQSEVAPAAAKCAELGLSRLLVDARLA